MLTEDIEKPSSFVMVSGLWGVLLFGPFALALLCYIWAFCSQSHSRSAFGEFIVLSLKRREKDLRGAQNTYYSAFALLLFDGFTVICGLVWGILMLCDNNEVVCLIFIYIWLAFRFISVCQHLIAALISVIFVCRPKWGEALHTVSKCLNVVPFVLVILSFRINDGILIGVDICNLLLILAIVVFCCFPSSSSSLAKQRKPFALLAVALFFLVCLPNVVMDCLVMTSDEYLNQAVDVLLITNFYIVMNGLLFYLVLKIKEDRSESQHECAIRSA